MYHNSSLKKIDVDKGFKIHIIFSSNNYILLGGVKNNNFGI